LESAQDVGRGFLAMTPEERYRRLDNAFDRALQLEGPARTAFLDEVCGDDRQMRQDLEGLLASHDRSGAFLAAPAIETAAKALARETGSTLVGRTLGPYPIRAVLGTGGMGDVYRAHDPRLGRDVAMKVLPSHLNTDRDALARFEREVRAVAALSHPNILAIHDVGTDQGIVYAVMALVDGDTLRERLAAGPLPWRQAVRVATQIADGLAAAHAKGIIHRDLKPANVVVDASGHATILDFGVARIVSGASPKAPAGLTEPGMVMGTLGYMSPEQIRGQPVGPASDLFALGCLMYEMVSGHPPFGGGASSESVEAVLRDDPAPLAGSARGLPPVLEAVIWHCLEKQASDRFQSASDLSFALRAILGDGRALAPAVPSPEPRRRSWMLPLVAALGVGVGGAAALWLRPAPLPAAVAHLTFPLPAPLVLAPNDSPAAGSSLAISRDGQWIAMVVQRAARRVLALRRIDRPELTMLPSTEGALSPVFSPDSRWIAYFTETDLRKVPLAGGTPTVLGGMPPVARGATWADDDFMYLSPSCAAGLQRMAASGGPITRVSEVEVNTGEGNHLLPEALPGGRALLFTVWKGGDFSTAEVWALSLTTGERKRLLPSAVAPRYVAPGFLVFARGGGLFAVRFDAERLTTSGEAIPIIDGVWTDRLSGTAHYAVSPSGTMVYAAGGDTLERRAENDTGWDVWTMHPGDNAPAKALIQTRFKDDQPMFAPNGLALAYVSDETGRLEVYVRPYPSMQRRIRISTDGG
jgi:hypothetical protein